MNKPRGILIAGNWKMNQIQKETQEFFDFLQNQADSRLNLSQSHSLFKEQRIRACLIPPYLSIEKSQNYASQMPFPVSIAAQNAHWERKGAYTGEISGPMLQELGVHWVLLGHSERRQYFGETNASVRKRADSLLQQGFHILFCIGETRKERESGLTETILAQQLTEAIPESNQGIANFLDGRVVFAYEPIWAIGTGLTATPQQAEEAQRFIRQLLYNHFGEKASTQTPILYGGSVIPENIQSLLSCPNVDGALVGGASLKAEHFLSLLKSAIEIL